MYVNREARVAYLAHPRTASRATAVALREQAGFERVGSHHDGPFDFEERRSRDAFDDEVDRVCRSGWTVVTTIRNHFGALASWTRKWDDPVVDPGDPSWWETWIRERAGRFFVDDGGEDWRLFWHEPAATFVIHYRALEFELNAVLRREGLPPVKLPEPDRDPAPPRSYRRVLSEDVRDWAVSRFGTEMRRFGFGW